MVATIDGQSWTSSNARAHPDSSDGRGFVIAGGDADCTVTVYLRWTAGRPQVGTYQLGTGINDVSGDSIGKRVKSGGPNNWSTWAGGSGTITVTSVSESAISGSFAFVAGSADGPGQSRTITGGTFTNVPVSSQWLPNSNCQ
jgi:hypothetical protein